MKLKNYLSLILLVLSLITGGSVLCSAGTTAPSLLSINMLPTSVDVSTASAEITISLHLTDNSSGVASWSTTLYSPSGDEALVITASPGLVSGTLTDGYFEGTAVLPQGSEEGAWYTDSVTVSDVAGNTAVINLSSYGVFLIQVGESLEDLTPPDVVSIEVSPIQINVTDQAQTVVVTAHLIDDLSGVDSARIYFYSPSKDRSVYTYLYRQSGETTDGIFRGTLSFPQYTESGSWTPSSCMDYSVTPYQRYDCLYVRDRVGNTANLNLQERGINLSIEVTSPPEDITAPVVQDLTLSTTLVDVTDGDVTATATAHITDDLSGFYRAYLRYYSPSKAYNNLVYLYRASGTMNDGIYRASLVFQQYAEAGVWSPTCTDTSVSPAREYPCMYVLDQVGNWSQRDLSSLGINTDIDVISPVEDVQPPELETLSISPSVIDISEGDAYLDVAAHLSDDLSGIYYGYLYLYSPSGRRYTNAVLYRESGTETDGIFGGSALFPQYTEPGVWRPQSCTDTSVIPYREYPCMYARDYVGNWGYIDLESKGIPLTLGVLSVPVEMTFILSPATDELNTGEVYTLTATVSQGALALVGSTVSFEVIDGPNKNILNTEVANADGQAIFSYTGNSAGIDTIIASVDVEGDGEVDAARQAMVTWIGTDSDGDGVTDDQDDCPNTPDGDTVDENGCAACQKDSDGDGVTDDLDLCADTPEGDTVDSVGCTVSDVLSCDVNGDQSVDISDIQLIFKAIGQVASGSDDPRDMNGDGIITINDARGCVLECDNDNCAPSM